MDCATERQCKCIKGLCTRLGRSLPDGFEELSKLDASACIEELLKKVEGGGFVRGDRVESQRTLDVGNGSGLSRDVLVRFGLAAKLVHQAWSHSGRAVLDDTDEFKGDVVALFGLLNDAEAAVALVGGGAQ